ncbi:hypothetical protein C5Y96_00075 [Blastopirellula marina]|uniref:Uncharacterized protein n=2 Tax=Pirellulales TaxID=2691354 RepID=A0A2S8GBH4_9BACT|nr:hypothetical protein C5Y96_00075 [Blastopirellula marina]RCS56357.1 hypothetical protein DTL36_00075 [Bremerella cremea]
MPKAMSNLNDQSQENNGYSGFIFAAFLAIFFCFLLFLAIPLLALAIYLLWILPSLIHAWVNITRQSRNLPLPWEDQFAALIVAFILQIPLWLTAGFLGFLLGALAYDLLVQASIPNIPPRLGGYFLFWSVTTLGVYLTLFSAVLLWTTIGSYSNDQDSKTVSIRDAKPIYHPF